MGISVYTFNRPPVLFRLFKATQFSDRVGPITNQGSSSVRSYKIGGWYKSACSGPVYIWPPGACTAFPHESPDPGCFCGFYAYFDPTAMLGDVNGLLENYHVGAVEIDGRVIIHEFGVRAEKMRVVKVWPKDKLLSAVKAACALSRTWHQSICGKRCHIPDPDELVKMYPRLFRRTPIPEIVHYTAGGTSADHRLDAKVYYLGGVGQPRKGI